MGVVLDSDGRAVFFDRALGQVFTGSIPTALENVKNGKGRFVHGDTGAEWDGEPVESPIGKPLEPAEPSLKLTQDDVLPLPGADGPGLAAITAERDAALTRAEVAEAALAKITTERDELLEQIDQLTAPAEVDDLADVRTTPGDSPEKLEAIEREVDEASAELSAAQVAALDGDGDGKAGGSKPRKVRSPEEQARRDAAIEGLNAKGIVFFKGSTTEALEAKLAES